jgi:hypothetical protein
MKSLLRRALITSLFISSLFSGVTEPQTGWSYIQGINQSFYMFLSPMSMQSSEGTPIDGYGDGSNGNSIEFSDCGLNPGCDVLGAFVTNNLDESTCSDAGGYYVNGQCDVCVGWSYYNSYSGNDGGYVLTTLAVIGHDSSDDDFEYYCQSDQMSNLKLKFYDVSDDLVYQLESDIELAGCIDLLTEIYYTDDIYFISSAEYSLCEFQGFILCEDGECVENEENCGELSNETPDDFSISEPYPNPFNPSTKISYTLGSLEHINISAYNTEGRHIVTLFDGFQDMGTHELTWFPKATISSGSYIIKVRKSGDLFTRKVTYVK